jgi:hypothetical protein
MIKYATLQEDGDDQFWLHVKLPDGRYKSWNLNNSVPFKDDPETSAMIEAWHKAENIDQSVTVTERMRE